MHLQSRPLDAAKPVEPLFFRDLTAWRDIGLTPMTTPQKTSFLPVALAASALFLVDGSLQPVLSDHVYPWYNSSYYVSNAVGDRAIGLLPFLLYQTGSDPAQTQLLKTGLALGDATVTALVIAQVLKQVTGRSRPINGADAGDWGHVNLNNVGQYTAMPSLHAVTYSTAATVLGQMMDCEGSMNLLFLALFTGDMASHNHWSSDMVVGAWLGRAIGEHWVNYYQSRSAGSDTWLLSPYVNPNTGSNFGFQFMLARHF